VAAGSPATYTYTSVVPAGATATITPTCEGGQVTGQTTSSFTCVFADVTAKTASHVKLQATILTNTFERSLDVNVLTRPTIVSAITGPPIVTAGTTANYTYTATYSSLALVFDQPTCGIYANVISGASGSITCQFKDVDNQVTTDVGITVSALGGSASSSKAVTVLPDVTPPVLTLPGTIKVNSASNAGANVNFTVTAVDAVSGPSQLITCSAFSGQLFPIGTTNVSCSAGDWTGNVANGSFAVVVSDVTAPSLTLPAPLTLNATAPNGAAATFVASAVDANPLAPLVTCQPASGSTFAIGTINVACSARDAAGNLTSGTFPITVIGAADQIAMLQRWVEKLTIDATLQRQLVSALKKAGAAAASGDSQSACKQLATVGSLVNDAGNKLTKGQFNKILNDVGSIRAVVGC
jgi:HYR domain